MSKALTLSKAVYSNWTDDVMFYLNSIRKTHPLTKQEETELFEKIKNGTEEEREKAKSEIILSNQRLVYSIAKEYAKGKDVMDIVNEGNKGWEDAFKKFDPSFGVRFTTYATYYIRRSIVAFFTNNGVMVRSANKQKLVGILPKIREKFFQENNREPLPEEIREILEDEYGVKIKENEDVYDVSVSSISEPMVGDDSTPSPVSLEYDAATAAYNEYEEQIESDANAYLVNHLLSVCDDDERTIIKMLYGIGQDNPSSPEYVAEMFNMTPSKVVQLKKNAIKKMQKASLQIRPI